jgi:hypothetical protein
MQIILTAVAAIAALGVTYLTYRQGYGGGAGFEGTSPSIVQVVSTALVMALGIFFGCLCACEAIFRRMFREDGTRTAGQ